ncbi:hypothetical protein LO763_22495 [Glycomyces sp. A-F 0318]|uniref:hypothetical protein n=1 Tax=Glycomyces amatae TaxID=2881355 RepID=UPI001E4EFEFF|nr:hypothetical protein [Glycomyces amatae]MCD0446389.1 hypothetical protein [Glycomyces amatae]
MAFDRYCELLHTSTDESTLQSCVSIVTVCGSALLSLHKHARAELAAGLERLHRKCLHTMLVNSIAELETFAAGR